MSKDVIASSNIVQGFRPPTTMSHSTPQTIMDSPRSLQHNDEALNEPKTFEERVDWAVRNGKIFVDDKDVYLGVEVPEISKKTPRKYVLAIQREYENSVGEARQKRQEEEK